jgi:hypothetical protein
VFGEGVHLVWEYSILSSMMLGCYVDIILE